jgi:hypothetical protein
MQSYILFECSVATDGDDGVSGDFSELIDPALDVVVCRPHRDIEDDDADLRLVVVQRANVVIDLLAGPVSCCRRRSMRSG